MKKYNVAILGATGAVGQEMLKVLGERNFPINDLKLLASKRSAGAIVEFNGEEYAIEEATESSFENIDVVLCAAENDISEKLSPAAVKAGAVVVDNSSAFRLYDDVPLVVPEVNGEDVKNHQGIIANPNCSTTIALTAINELNKYSPIKRMIVTTFQAVSGAGVNGIKELNQQIKDISEGKDVEINTFQHQIAYNVIPQIGSFNEMGYSQEEMKLLNEGRKILHNPDLKVNCTCVRVPVYRSHSESITIETEKEITVEKARELLSKAAGVKLIDDLENNKYPMPLDSSDQDLIYVGRIRKDISGENSLVLWCCGDQIRKGAATNAVQIAEVLVKENLI
ncbi:MAG: aspartate-semialdehyde dehydrogenase [Tissierellia bacterium]|jgi:aspartate-semialdehyde dehydrogenase|nr:aspartate-semialdehyde dehydrogenase [Sedimentibacter sp.]NLA13224.1 aspartate-semialdehyde dehydrogenase [Tissierellia bacterium]HOA19762.1 aspartate-semialdehyde dehydrogenase [Sedimentibacter sp.]HOG62953.1 aspartate-semialdehyde dehydrogenase [Sedimentibacter sp.]HQK54504.1 aspartate-semialdehyde dehydrogenase [Sedimentibacter sp.]